MNREVKFRAWHKKKQCWYALDYLILDNPTGSIKAVGIGIDFSYAGTSIDEVVLVRYTGLKDKNGKDIYEGDIVETIYGNEIVEFNEYISGYSPFVEADMDGNHNYVASEVEVIGNTYENPELLK